MSGGGRRSVLAVRFAHREATRAEHFHGGEPSDEPMPMSYYLWAVGGAGRPIVVDTGFGPATAAQRERPLLADPLALLARAGVAAHEVRDVVLTHLHYDHVGNLDAFPAARFWVQGRELDFWSGPLAARREYRRHVEPEQLAQLAQLAAAGRVRRLDGDAELVPGVTLHRVGGHSPGLQVVRVACHDGPLVIASDALHYDENLAADRPYAIVHDLAEMYQAFDRVLALAGGVPARVIAGHDPAVVERFPAVVPGLVVRAGDGAG